MKPRTIRNLFVGIVALSAIILADQWGYLPITDTGKFKNRVMYNLSKLEADAQTEVDLSVLQAEVGQYYQDLENPLFANSDQQARFQTICLRFERAYYARILWNRSNNATYSKDQLNHDLTVFQAAFPTSHLADGLLKPKTSSPGTATKTMKVPKDVSTVPTPTPVVEKVSQRLPATETERIRELESTADFLAYQSALEAFKRDFPNSPDAARLDERLLELNIEYLKASHQ